MVALGAIFILIIGVGPVRLSVGDFLANTLGIARRTFAPSEVLVGEIPLGQISKSTSTKSNQTISKPTSPTAKTSGLVNKTVADSKDKEIAALNDKINALQAQLSSVSSTVPVISISTSTSAQNQSQISISQTQIQTQASIQQTIVQNTNPVGTGKVLVSEIMAGADGNGNYEFVELYNVGSAPVDLTGWSIKKKSSSGSESSLVATSRLSGKIIQPNHYFLLGNETGYQGSVSLDVAWPSSYTLAYTNNSVVLYNNGSKVEEVFWAEIPKDQSFVRTGWEGNQFALSSSPSPQNSQSP